MLLAKWRVTTLEGLLNCFLFLHGGLLTKNSEFNALYLGRMTNFADDGCGFLISWIYVGWECSGLHLGDGWDEGLWCLSPRARVFIILVIDLYHIHTRSYPSPSGKSMARICYNHAGLHVNESDASFIISFYDIGFIISTPRVTEEDSVLSSARRHLQAVLRAQQYLLFSITVASMWTRLWANFASIS